MADRIPLDRRLDRGRVALVLELRGVDADDDELLGEPLLDRPQLVEDVQAVDAAERPEVEQHDATAQLGEGQVVTAGVEPAAAAQLGAPEPRTSVRTVGKAPVGQDREVGPP